MLGGERHGRGDAGAEVRVDPGPMASLRLPPGLCSINASPAASAFRLPLDPRLTDRSLAGVGTGPSRCCEIRTRTGNKSYSAPRDATL